VGVRRPRGRPRTGRFARQRTSPERGRPRDRPAVCQRVRVVATRGPRSRARPAIGACVRVDRAGGLKAGAGQAVRERVRVVGTRGTTSRAPLGTGRDEEEGGQPGDDREAERPLDEHEEHAEARDAEPHRPERLRRGRPPEIAPGSVVSLRDVADRSRAADDAVDHERPFARLALRDVVGDHVADVVGPLSDEDREVSGVEPRLHARPGDDDVGGGPTQHLGAKGHRPRQGERDGRHRQRDPNRPAS
jgi:hypothetical protein